MNIEALQAAARRLEVDLPAVQAVAEVESSGVPFWTIDGRSVPPIRLEAHWFGKLTGYRYNISHPRISCVKWDPSLAATTREGAWAQYEEAKELDLPAAVQACSWGAFQIMGYHFPRLGYATCAEFVGAMHSEEGQLEAFARFIEKDPALRSALAIHAWRGFAAGYNGNGQVDTYAARLEAAFARHGGVA